MKIFTSLRSVLWQGMILVIALISGYCGMVYQVIWNRLLSYHFGADTVSSMIVATAFVGGLGIGAYLSGKINKKYWLVYASIECLLGAYGLLSLTYVSMVSSGLRFFSSYLSIQPEQYRVILAIGVFLLVLVPAILFGACLPLLVRVFGANKASSIGVLYGVNTLGSAIALSAVPLFLFNTYPLSRVLTMTSVANLLVAILVLAAGLIKRFDEPIGHYSLKLTKRTLVLYTLCFFSGAVSIAVEILFLRVASVYWPSSGYSYPFVVSILLFGYGTGSFVLTYVRVHSNSTRWKRIGMLCVLCGVALVWAVVFRERFGADLTPRVVFRQLAFLIFPYAFIQGGIFPLLMTLLGKSEGNASASVGAAYLTNAIGTILGALVIQTVGFSTLGTRGIVMTIVYLYAALSLGLFVVSLRYFFGSLIVWSGIIALAIVLPFRYWDIFIYNNANSSAEKTEGVSGVAVLDWNATDPTQAAVLVNGQYMSNLPRHPRHILLGSYAQLYQPRHRILVLGLGGGGMAADIIEDQSIERIDIVEWSHELPRLLSQEPAASSINHLLTNPRVHLVSADARLAVAVLPPQSYDIVIDNLAVVTWAGATGIKSIEFYREIARVLRDDGIFVLEVNNFDQETYHAVLSTLTRVFPYVKTHYDFIAIASKQEASFDSDLVERVYREKGPSIGIGEPYDAWFVSGIQTITKDQYTNISPIVDDDIRFEYRY